MPFPSNSLIPFILGIFFLLPVASIIVFALYFLLTVVTLKPSPSISIFITSSFFTSIPKFLACFMPSAYKLLPSIPFLNP